MAPLIPRMTTRVVGVTHGDGYPESLHRLSESAQVTAVDDDGYALEGVAAVLEAEPWNAHDPNAVGVHVPAVGCKVGHLSRDLAALVGPRLADGVRFRCEVVSVLVHPEHPDRPGLTVSIEEVDDDR